MAERDYTIAVRTWWGILGVEAHFEAENTSHTPAELKTRIEAILTQIAEPTEEMVRDLVLAATHLWNTLRPLDSSIEAVRVVNGPLEVVHRLRIEE